MISWRTMAETKIIIIGTDPVRRSDRDLAAAFSIRRAVFCVEQGVSEAEEMDGLDGICRQYIALASGVPVGTARTRFLTSGAAKIERVAVLKPHRRSGIGRQLMLHILDNTTTDTVLNAQIVVRDFYTALGFISEGDIFDEAGIEHIHMTRKG